MNTAQIAQQETALEWLPDETKALIYYALKGLQAEAERHMWSNEINPLNYTTDMLEYHKNIAVKCAGLARYLAETADQQQLSLLTHFAPGK